MTTNPFRFNPKLAQQRWLIIITIMMVAILEVLDSTIVNVALPNMMPALGANQEQITWVLTAYVVASAMMIPLTGFLSRYFGHRQLLVVNIIGFMISSFLCGMTSSFTMMIIFRLLQGGFGAALIPLSQAILRMSFPLEEQGKAMAIWGIGIMAAPVFGPTLGGFITEQADWRWVFYINTPICLISLLLTLLVIEPGSDRSEKIDFVGVIFMFLAVGALQLFLDQGNSKDWFNSSFILGLFVTAIVSTILFIWRNSTHSNPVVNFSIFKDRNFTLSTICLAAFAGLLFANITLQPIMMETLFSYTPMIAGSTMSPSGLFSAFGMIISSQLMLRVNVRYLLIIAALICSAGSFYMSSLSLDATQWNFIVANMILGTGLGLFMVPLSTYALATIKPKFFTEASGLFSYGRMLGVSVGISIFSTLVSRLTQINWNEMGGHITIFNTNLQIWLQKMHLNLQDPHSTAILQKSLLAQANMSAFLDAYYTMGIAFLFLIPLVIIMKNVKLSDETPMGH